ncbi:MAG: hypothetical protein KAS12_01690 [Candidatus Aenigmarchaeota archaeon]|nr:hypothetical protein [Candidatus Aenigmarchaeota archaeon]
MDEQFIEKYGRKITKIEDFMLDDDILDAHIQAARMNAKKNQTITPNDREVQLPNNKEV